MASWQRQLGAVTSLVLLTVGSRPGLAGPPAASSPSPELLEATRVLDRLMATASIEAPITLIVRPFRGPVCLPSEADPVTRTEAVAMKQPPLNSAVCLSGFELPPRLRRGFFVPFVVSLQRQVDPESDPEQPSAAIEEGTILLNATGLELVREVSPPGKRQQPEPAPVLPPAATCRIALEFAAVQLNQPGQRRESFARIHTLLAERIHKVEGQSPGSPSFAESLALSVLTMGQLERGGGGILGYIFSIPGRNQGHWINARLAESPHWQVLQRHAPVVAASLKGLRRLPEGHVQCNLSGQCPSLLSDLWKQIDGWFGIAAHEREEVIEEQRNQAQAEALRLLAAAGIDPRPCTGVFLPTSDAQTDPALVQVYERARRKAAGVSPMLPHQYLPAEQKVVIFPRSAQPGLGSPSPGPSVDPGGSKP